MLRSTGNRQANKTIGHVSLYIRALYFFQLISSFTETGIRSSRIHRSVNHLHRIGICYKCTTSTGSHRKGSLSVS